MCHHTLSITNICFSIANRTPGLFDFRSKRHHCCFSRIFFLHILDLDHVFTFWWRTIQTCIHVIRNKLIENMAH